MWWQAMESNMTSELPRFETVSVEQPALRLRDGEAGAPVTALILQAR
jgi:hypothetical protein